MGDDTTLDPDQPPKPIEVNPNPLPAQGGTLTRDIIILATALPTLIAILGKKDVLQIVSYIASTEFAPALGVIVAAGTLIWRQWISRRTTAKSVAMAKSAKDSVAFLKSK